MYVYMWVVCVCTGSPKLRQEGGPPCQALAGIPTSSAALHGFCFGSHNLLHTVETKTQKGARWTEESSAWEWQEGETGRIERPGPGMRKKNTPLGAGGAVWI